MNQSTSYYLNCRKVFRADDLDTKMNILKSHIIFLFYAGGSFILWGICILVLNLHNVQYKVSFSKKITYQNSYITHSWIHKKCIMVLIKPNERKVLNWITEVNENVPSVFQFELYEYQNVHHNLSSYWIYNYRFLKKITIILF